MFSVALILLLAAGSCVNSIDLIQPDSMVVQPGQSLTITCQVSGYSLTDNNYATGWIRQREGKPMDWICSRWGGGGFDQNNALKNKFLYHTHTSASRVTLTGQNLQPEDTAVYYCVRLYYSGYGSGFDYWGKGTTVTVTSATPNAPTVFPLMQCGSGTGNTVTLGCLATGFTPSSLTYSWSTGNGAALTDFIQYPPVLKDNLYTGISQVKVSKQDWDAIKSFRCDVTHTAGNQHVIFGPREPNGDLYQLPTLKVMTSSSGEGTETTLSCFAKDFSPKDFEFKWLKNQEEITTGITNIKTPFDEKNTENGTLYSAASFLTVPSSQWAPAITYTCEFTGKGVQGPMYVNSSATKDVCINGDDKVCVKADMDVTIIKPKMEDFVLNGKGEVKCQVTINKPSVQKIFWETHDGKEIPGAVEPNKGETGVKNVLLPITFEEWRQGAKFICTVQHDNWLEPRTEIYTRTTELWNPEVYQSNSDTETDKDNMVTTAITFILLFLITLLFTIGTTAFRIK